VAHAHVREKWSEPANTCVCERERVYVCTKESEIETEQAGRRRECALKRGTEDASAQRSETEGGKESASMIVGDNASDEERIHEN